MTSNGGRGRRGEREGGGGGEGSWMRKPKVLTAMTGGGSAGGCVGGGSACLQLVVRQLELHHHPQHPLLQAVAATPQPVSLRGNWQVEARAQPQALQDRAIEALCDGPLQAAAAQRVLGAVGRVIIRTGFAEMSRGACMAGQLARLEFHYDMIASNEQNMAQTLTCWVSGKRELTVR
jgi:hypothetical protein